MASKARFTVGQEIPELSSWIYRAQLIDVSGQPILPGTIVSLVLTIYDVATNQVINSVAGLNILNSGRGTVGDDGTLTIKFLPSDTPIVSNGLTVEAHIALVRCSYNGGEDAWVREIFHKVTNLTRVP